MGYIEVRRNFLEKAQKLACLSSPSIEDIDAVLDSLSELVSELSCEKLAVILVKVKEK